MTQVLSHLRHPAIIFSAVYTGQYIFLGVKLPFIGGWLALNGFSAGDIGLLTGFALAMRLALGPAIGYWADRQADAHRGLRVTAGIMAISGVMLSFANNPVLIAVAVIGAYWSFGVAMPLTDTSVLRADRAGSLNYGRIRSVGSGVFLLTTIGAGALFSQFGVGVAAWLMAGAAVFAWAASYALPHTPRVGAPSQTTWHDLRQFFKSRLFIAGTLGFGLVQGAHATYYAFSYLRWSEIGYADTTIGFLWATGVIAEIGLLLLARRMTRLFSPLFLLSVGAIGAAARWTITALEPPIGLLFFVQTGHAATFAATYIGSLEFVDRACPPALTNTAMTFMSTFGIGAATGLATIGAGWLWEVYSPAAAYLAMAVMGMFALGIAIVLRQYWRGERLFDA